MISVIVSTYKPSSTITGFEVIDISIIMFDGMDMNTLKYYVLLYQMVLYFCSSRWVIFGVILFLVAVTMSLFVVFYLSA